MNRRRMIALITLSTLIFSAPITFAECQDKADAVRQWRSEKITQLSERLRDSQLDSLDRDEMLAQRDWLMSWMPGEMNHEVHDRSDELVPEPKLESVESPVGIEPEEWERVVEQQALLMKTDQDQLRKANLKQTIEIAAGLEKRLASLLRDRNPPLSTEPAWALAYVRYRLARAIAYRELPDVISDWPITDEDHHDRRLKAAVNRLREQTVKVRPEFILIEDRMLRREGFNGRALQMLERNRSYIEPRWYFKKRRDLLEKLGWSFPHQEAAKIYRKAGFED